MSKIKFYLGALLLSAAAPAVCLAQTYSAADNHDSKVITSNFLKGITITTSNIFDLRSAYDGSDLLSNLPSMNGDLALLQQHKKFDDMYSASGAVAYPRKALLEISGAVAVAGMIGQKVSNPTAAAKQVYFSNIYLDHSQLEFNAFINPWVGAFIEVDKGGNSTDFTPVVHRAWFTIGNLNRTPFYMSAGQMYVPFGSYSSSMLSDPLTKTLFRSENPTALLGVSMGSFYGQAYVYEGHAVKNSDAIENGGVNLGYGFTAGRYNFTMGAGVISNVGDSNNIAAAYGSTKFGSRTPGVDVHAEESLQLKNFTIGGKAEYIQALGKMQNSTFDGKLAQPSALHVEGDLDTTIMDRPVGTFLAYGHSWQGLGINTTDNDSSHYVDWTNLPQWMIATGVNASIWRGTIESLEYRYNQAYNTTATFGNVKNNLVTQNGKSENIVSMEITAYF